MKIAFVRTWSEFRFNPRSFSHTAWLLRYLAENGHEVTIVEYKYSSADAEVEHDAGLTIVRLTVFGLDQGRLYRLLRVKVHSPGWILERLLWTFSLIRYLRRNKFDTIYYLETFTALMLIFLFPQIRKKLVLYWIMPLEEGEKLSWPDRFRLSLTSFVGRHIKMTIVENIVAERCLVAYGIGSDKVMVIEPGVDTKFWVPDMGGEKVRNSYNLNDKVVILFQARVVPRKGVEYLIKAADILVHEKGYQNLAFLIVGPPREAVVAIPGREELSDYVERLESLVQSLSLGQVVKLLIGWQPDDYLREFYAAADIYVLPTLEDMTPHSIKQAMAVGKPAVSTRVGWVPTLIEDGENGFLVEARQERDLANALEKLIVDEELRKRMGLNNQRKVQERWTMEQETGKWEALLLRMSQDQ